MTCKSISRNLRYPILYCALLSLGTACNDTPIVDNTLIIDPTDPPTLTETMAAWQEARLGLFIHYGVYSGLGGEYIGPDIYGENKIFQSYGNLNTAEATQIGSGVGAEWIMDEALIPKENYRAYASRFTAENFDPQEIVAIAKKAGMRYIILTSKHHEGFCLWDSKTTDWDITATPAGQQWKETNDLIGSLAQATRDAGMMFGLYFSEFRDWMHPGAPLPITEVVPEGYTEEEQQEYMETYTYPMIKELMERYAPDIFWWDGTYDNAEFAACCDSIVRSYNYGATLQNDRLSSATGYGGDFETPEQSMNEESVSENSELCMTINNTWGYNQFDTNWKHPAYILYSMLRAQKLGCNLLLNIGPEADGSIPDGSLHVLEALGAWMEGNEESAHGTEKSPFSYNLPYGPTTYRTIGGGKALYYHVLYWDKSGELWIPGVMNPADEVEVSFLANPGIPIKIESRDNIGLYISGLPTEAPDSLCNTLKIEFLTEPILDEGIRFIGDTAYLDALGAKISSITVGDWSTRPAILWFGGQSIKYKLNIPSEGEYQISAELAAYFNGTITFQFSDGTTLTGNNTVTPGGHATFQWQDMGTVHLPQGTYELTISSQQEDSWLRLHQFRLIRH